MKRIEKYIFNELENDILNYLWKRKESSARILYKLFGKKHKVTYSTISVTLNRLYKKGILKRRAEKTKGGKRFVYYPKITKEELGYKIAIKFLEFLRKNFGEACISNLKKKIK